MKKGSYQFAFAALQALIEAAKAESAQKKRSAVDAWRRAASRSLCLLGADHDWTIFCQASLGKTLVELGFYDESIPLVKAAVARAETVTGRVHNSVELMHQCLARAYQGLGDNQKGYEHWLRAAQVSQEKRRLEHSTTVYCYHQAARALSRLLRFDDALPLFKLVYKIDLELFGDHIRTAFAARDLAICLSHKQRLHQSLHYWRIASILMRRFLPDEDPVRQKVKRSYHWTLNEVRQRRFEQKLTSLSPNSTTATQ